MVLVVFFFYSKMLTPAKRAATLNPAAASKLLEPTVEIAPLEFLVVLLLAAPVASTEPGAPEERVTGLDPKKTQGMNTK